MANINFGIFIVISMIFGNVVILMRGLYLNNFEILSNGAPYFIVFGFLLSVIMASIMNMVSEKDGK